MSGRPGLVARAGHTVRRLPAVLAVGAQRCGDRHGQREHDDPERERDRDVHEPLEQHLGADEDQDEREADPQVAEAVRRTGQQGVERAHAEQREGVGAEHDERVGRDAEDRRDRVHGEDHVGGRDGEDDHQQGRGVALAVALDGEPAVLVVVGDRHQAPRQADARVRVRVEGAVVLAVQGHPDARDEQDRAEDVEHEVQGVHELGARGDEDEPQDERQDDADLQDLLAVGVRHGHGPEDQGEDEQVVQRQRALEQVAREELAAGP
jgi:hypothetical protein